MKRTLWVTLSVLLGSSLLGACVDEEIVYRDRDLIGELPTAAASFVGYSDEEEKLTVCGNCHVGQQQEWEGTAHANAWEGLQASGHAASYCENCHTVNSLGNAAADTMGGWPGTKDTRYYDVQCEACHGPGLGHIRNPDETQPLAPIRVGLDMTTGCGECHRDAHHPFTEEWEQSPHAVLNMGTAASPGPAQRAGCVNCHEASGILAAWRVRDNYLEKDSLGIGKAGAPVTCSVCHDPHSNEFQGQLRFPAHNVKDVSEHLCAQCHNRRNVPAPGSTHGLEPHAPEAPLLEGEAGYLMPGSEFLKGTRGTHGNPSRNPGLCTTCHVTSFEVTDQQTGKFKVTATGHLFNGIPCKDEAGIPQPRTTKCAVTAEARSFKGCTGSGCHGGDAEAASILRTTSMRLQRLADELEHMLEQADPNMLGAGGPINPSDATVTVAEGAFFNVELAQFSGDIENETPTATSLKTWGTAAHNPFLMESLLLSSIDAVEATYGVHASKGLPRVNLLKQPQH